MDCFGLLAYASLAASRTLLQQLLVCLNFTLDSEDLFCWYKLKKLFPWIMTAAQEAKTDRDERDLSWHDEEYILQLQPEPTHKIH